MKWLTAFAIVLLVVSGGWARAGDDPGAAPARQWLRGLSSADEAERQATEAAILAAPKERVVPPLVLALALGSSEARAFAAGALGSCRDPQVVRPLLARVLDDDAEAVRAAAARSLVAVAGRDVAWDLVPALTQASVLRRMRAAQGLAWVGNPYAVGPLIGVLRIHIAGGGGPRAHIMVAEQFPYVGDYDVEIATNAIAYDPVIRTVQSGTVLDARVHRVEREIEIEEHLAYRNALRDLTGQDFGTDAGAWEVWYEKNAEVLTAAYRKEKEDAGAARAATRLLREARAAEAREEFEGALRLYRRIEGEYARLAQAGEAAGRREALEASAYVMMKVEEARETATARNWLSLAKSYAANGLDERAAEFARRVLHSFPDTAEAREAQALLGTPPAGGPAGR